MAVQSKAHAVGSRTISARGGLSVIAHQAVSNPMYGQIGLELLQQGYSPQQALDFMLRGDEGRDSRQVAILDMQGRSAAWTGKSASAADWKGHRCTPGYCRGQYSGRAAGARGNGEAFRGGSQSAACGKAPRRA